MTPEKVINNFSRCPNWEERYLYLIELGKQVPRYPQDKLNDAFLVEGCQSQVWLDIQIESNCVSISAQSDTLLVQGLVALIWIAYDGKSPQDILAFDIQSWFVQLGLDQHLTSTRTLGFKAMVSRVCEFATNCR